MYIQKLQLQNFRNYLQLNIELSSRVNVIVGDNAQGKTNILEALYFLSEGSSFRVSRAQDLIRWGSGQGAISATLIRGDLTDTISIDITEEGKTYYRNEKRARRGDVATVLFAPEALLLMKEGPAGRRRFMDHLFSAIYPNYRTALNRYQKALMQYSRLLREQEAQFESQCAVWRESLIGYGATLTHLRAQGIVSVNQHLPAAYAAIAKGAEPATLIYEPRNGAEVLLEGEAALQQALRQAFRERAQDELIRRTVLVGPHRDELTAWIGKKDVRHFASQGEHRTLILALKRCEIRLLEEETGYPPILLLDDVASELDSHRNERFFHHLLDMPGQVLITAVSQKHVPLDQAAAWWQVSSGQVHCLERP